MVAVTLLTAFFRNIKPLACYNPKMKIFAQILDPSENAKNIPQQPPATDDNVLKFIAIGAVVLFIALVIAILVAKRR